MLNVFAEQFGTALADAGRNVIYFDCGKEDLGRLTSYMYQHFQAIIGIQSYLFSVKMKDEVHYLHEYLYGPKYNFIFDHPIWMKQHLMHHYPDFYVLTHDENYVAFLQKYLKKEAILFPPAGLSLLTTRQILIVFKPCMMLLSSALMAIICRKSF